MNYNVSNKSQNLIKMRYILNKVILLTTVLVSSVFTTSVFAEELKRSCVKDNPLVAGESDPALIQIYSQVCDKKNKDNNNEYLAQAAQRFQQIGRNYKALQLVNELNAKQVQHSSLTDVKFLAGVAIANEALTQIRDKEVRYLSDDAYAPAVAFSDAVRKAKPLSVIETKVEESPKRNYEPKRAYEPKQSKPRTQTKSSSVKTSKAPAKTVTKTTTTKPAVSTPAKAPAKNPFGNL